MENTWNASLFFYHPTHNFVEANIFPKIFMYDVFLHSLSISFFLPLDVRVYARTIPFSADIQLGNIEMKVNKSFGGSLDCISLTKWHENHEACWTELISFLAAKRGIKCHSIQIT